jgi:hypothetical protein
MDADMVTGMVRYMGVARGAATGADIAMGTALDVATCR